MTATPAPALTPIHMENASSFEVAKAFAETFWGRLTQPAGEIAAWFGSAPSDPRAVAVPVGDAAAFAKVTAAHEDAQLAYCGLAVRETGTVKGHAHGAIHQLLPARHIFFDLDTGKLGYAPTKDAALAQVLSFAEAAGITPHILVETAHGYHVYYLLTEPLDDPERMTLPARMEAAFTAHLGLSGYTMDQGVTTQMTRLGRIPGTWNRKADLAQPFRTELHSIGEHPLYSPDALLAQLPDAAAVSSPGQGALPIVYDERVGAELARALPISRILTEVHEWTRVGKTQQGVELWDAHCDAAESDVNARSVWGVRQIPGQVRTDDRAEAVYVYSATTAAEYGVPAGTRLTSFVWIAHRFFGGDYRAAVGLAAAFKDRADELVAVLVNDPSTADLADLARQASSVWPEGLTKAHAGYLRYRAVAPDVATARGYSSLTAAEVMAVVDSSTSQEVRAAVTAGGIGAMKAPVISLRGERTATLRLDRTVVLPPVTPNDDPISYRSLRGDRYSRKAIDMNPVCRPLAPRSDVPLIVTAADYRGRAIHSNPTNVQHGQVHADAITSAGLREGLELAVVSLARWSDGLHARGTAAADYGREDRLVDDWARLVVEGRTTYIAGRVHWRRSESLIALATLLEAKGATVRVIDLPIPEDGPETAGADRSVYAISDYLAEAAARSDAKPLTGLLAAALPLEEAAWQATPMEDTEVGRAERLTAEIRRRGSHRYDATNKLWMENSGTHWKASPAASPSALAVEIFRAAGAKLGGIGGVTRPVSFVATHPAIAVEASSMGTAARELNVMNGVVDLTSGILRDRTEDDVHLTVCPAVYTPGKVARRWAAFIKEITLGDADYADYLQRHVGQILVGEVIQETLFFAVGGGGNGKSVFYSTLAALLAGYATSAPTEMLTGKPAPHQIAGLFSKRLLIASETDEGERISGAALKELAKRDGLKGAKKFGHEFDFAASHTPVLMTNHKPSITATDRGTWRRIELLPFDLQLTDAQMDKTLPAQLLNEVDGILAWAVEGAVKFLAQGLGTCEKVQTATEGYREEQDVLGRFLRDEYHLTGDPKDRVKRASFHTDLNYWLVSPEAGLRGTWSAKAIGDKLGSRGVTVKRQADGEYYCGIKEGPAPRSEREIAEIFADTPTPDSLADMPSSEVASAFQALEVAFKAEEWEF
ncbi:DNA primase family protein [Specibacter sp. RAF43]|uniref:DNA primase family protein n=1 Tax=Specibacter sp. RAF43 TaxID=3233057 RepID=UPI003F970716